MNREPASGVVPSRIREQEAAPSKPAKQPAHSRWSSAQAITHKTAGVRQDAMTDTSLAANSQSDVKAPANRIVIE